MTAERELELHGMSDAWINEMLLIRREEVAELEGELARRNPKRGLGMASETPALTFFHRRSYV